MRLTMKQSGDQAELIVFDDQGRHVAVAYLLRMFDDEPFTVRNREYPDLRDVFSSRDVRLSLDWLEERATSCDDLDVSAWEWSVPDTGGSLFCIGRNYAAHAAELGNKVPGQPMFFMKPRGCLAANDMEVQIPSSSERVDYEGELALIIGSNVSGAISSDEARATVVAVTLLNDITDRAAQNAAKEAGKPWFRAKGPRGFAPMGPYLLTVDEEHPLTAFNYSTKLNGNLVQSGNPDLWLWQAEAMIQDLSMISGLESGDIIATGTPAGVGPVKAGDVVELESPKIGILRTRFS
jgi:2-keto-4-pentenoate hydratase/2-oxohepta-3-ene-1,7-dioic acid hydratase in catechol pathway